MAKKSIVIIGGGPAGLTAAYELLKDNGSEQYDVTVLEASGEFGGFFPYCAPQRESYGYRWSSLLLEG